MPTPPPGHAAVRPHVAEIRNRRGLSVAELARRVGVSRQAIYSIEDGTYIPNTAVALRLAETLNSTVEELFRTSDTAPSRQREIKAELLASETESVLPHALVRLCSINNRLRAAPVSFIPEFLPIADGSIERKSHSTVSVNTGVPLSELGNRILLAGCDPALSLLAAAVKPAGVEIITVSCSSRRALEWLKRGRVHAAGCHLLDRASGERNLPAIRRLFSKRGMRVITFAEWEQGLIVKRGNPKSIRTIADVARRDVALINREKGSGTRDLLDRALRNAGIPPQAVQGYNRIAYGHLTAAFAVATGSADCCVATRSAARYFALDFIPLAADRFDVCIPEPYFHSPAIEAVMEWLNHSRLRRQLETLAGYDTAHTGDVLM